MTSSKYRVKIIAEKCAVTGNCEENQSRPACRLIGIQANYRMVEFRWIFRWEGKERKTERVEALEQHLGKLPYKGGEGSEKNLLCKFLARR